MLSYWWRKLVMKRMTRAAAKAGRRPLRLEGLEDRATPAGLFAVGSVPGAPSLVTVFDAATRQQTFTINPYPGFTGGVNVAVGDVNGDGTPDIITGTGAGGGPVVNVYSGEDGSFLKSFTVGDATSRAGASVAAADFDQDGLADLVVGTMRNGQPLIQVLRFADGTALHGYTPFTGAAGVSVAAGDVNGDGTPDVIAGSGAGVSNAVAVFNGLTDQTLQTLAPFEATFTGGIQVSAGDVDGDGKADIIAAAGVTGGPRVTALAGGTGRVIANFFAYDSALRDGTRAVAFDADANGSLDLVTVNGPGHPADTRAFSPLTLAQLTVPAFNGLPVGTVYDTTAPAVTVTSSAPDPTSTSPVPFIATFSEPVNGFTPGDIVVTNGPVVNFTKVDAKTYTFGVAAATNGPVTVSVPAGVVTDSAGNQNTASASVTRTFDTTAPAAPAVTGIATDTGASATDGVTSDNTLVVNGTAAAGSTVEVFRTGTSVGTTTATSGGTWSLDTTGTTLADGTYTFTATARDAAGNTSPSSAGFVVVVDTSTPAAPTITGFADDTGTQGDSVTSDNTLTLTGTAEANSTVRVLDGSTPLGTATLTGTTWTFTTAALPDGPHTFTAIQTDLAGNGPSAASAALTVTIDTAAPAVVGVDSTTPDGTYTTGATIDIPVTISEPVTVDTTGGTPTLALNSGGTATYQGGSGTTTLTFRYTVAAGDSSADLDYTGTTALALNGGTIADAAGNAANLTLPAPGAAGSLGANRNIVIDTATPSVVSITPGTAGPTNAATVTYTVTFNEPVTGVDAPDFAVAASGITGAAITGVSGSGATYTVTVGTGSGTGTIGLNLVDDDSIQDTAGNPLGGSGAGNGDFTGGTVQVDTVAPTADITDVTPDPRNTEVGTVTVAFSEPVTGFDLSDLSLTRDGSPVDLTGATLNTADNTTWTLTLPAGTTAADGTYVLTLTAAGSGIQDAAGNPLAADASDSWVTDTTAPDTTLAFPAAGATYAAATWADAISGTASDAGGSGATSVQVAVQQVSSGNFWNPATSAFDSSAAVPMTASVDPITGAWSLAFPGTNFPADGDYTVTAAAVDVAGNTDASPATATFTFDAAPLATTTAVSSDANPSVTGQPVTFSGTIAAVAPGAGTPTGTADLVIDGTTVQSGVAVTGGQVTFAPVSGLGAAGSPHTVQVVYNGGATFGGSTGILAGGQTVLPAATTTAVTSSLNPSLLGDSVTLTATVTANSPGAGIPTGTVTFVDTTTGTTLAAVPLDGSGQATLTTSALAAGTHDITATYGGDANFTASSGTVTQDVTPPA